MKNTTNYVNMGMPPLEGYIVFAACTNVPFLF